MTHEPGEDLLGHITFSLDEKEQPAGYQFTPLSGSKGSIFPTIAEALRAQFGEVHLRIESIVAERADPSINPDPIDPIKTSLSA